MLALVGVDLPQLEARLVERRRLLEAPTSAASRFVAGFVGHQAAHEELERRRRRPRGHGGSAAGRAGGTSRRPTRAATSKRSARGPRSTISSAMSPVSTRIVRARSTSSPAVASMRPDDRRRRADHARQPDDGGVAEERNARHPQPLHRLQPIVARDGRHAGGAQFAREGDGRQLAEPVRLRLVRVGLERHHQRPWPAGRAPARWLDDRDDGRERQQHAAPRRFPAASLRAAPPAATPAR